MWGCWGGGGGGGGGGGEPEMSLCRLGCLLHSCLDRPVIACMRLRATFVYVNHLRGCRGCESLAPLFLELWAEMFGNPCSIQREKSNQPRG